jgi:predicted amidohydrolase
MNARFVDRLSLCSAIGIGLVVSTGHPVGIIAAAGMPLACLIPGARKAVFKSSLAYYLAGLWPMVPGLDRYLGESVSPFIPVTLWVLISALLSAPWAIVWTSERHVDYLWRVPLALLATVVPPLGIIGFISPLTAAGYLFPGTAWFGLTAVALLPGILLSTDSLDLRRRSAVLLVVTTVAVGLAIGGRVLSPSTKSIPGWMAVNTSFGDVSRPFQAFVAARYIQSKAAAASARVLIFPEAVVPRWSDATAAFWHESLDHCRARGQILVVGAGLPAQSASEPEDRERLRALQFGAALDVLAGIDKQSVPGIESPVTSNMLNRPVPERSENAALILGSESATFYQRVPVPIGMWRPFSKDGVPLRLWAPGVLAIDHQRTALLICYEQMLVFPVLASMLRHPSVIIGLSNTFWFDGTTVPRYQTSALRAWAKLFHLPVFSAVNS